MITKENARLEALRLASYNEANEESIIAKAELFYKFLTKDGTYEVVKKATAKKK